MIARRQTTSRTILVVVATAGITSWLAHKRHAARGELYDSRLMLEGTLLDGGPALEPHVEVGPRPDPGFGGDLGLGHAPVARSSRRGRRHSHRRPISVPRLLAVDALVLAIALASVVVAAKGGPAAPATPIRSAASSTPTPTPEAPGITIATASIDLPDPFLYPVGNQYALFVSTAFGDYKRNVPVFVGRPGAWGQPRDALPTLPRWAVPANGTSTGGITWAPFVYRFNSTFVLYFSSSLPGKKQHCIGTATSPVVTGPYVPDQTPIVCQRNFGGDIDAQPFIDYTSSSGIPQRYLVWKSDNNSTAGTGIPTIWSQPLSADGRHLSGKPKRIFMPDRPWEGTLVEAPQMVRGPDGRLWLFFSAGSSFATPGGYGIGVASCAGPQGPCRSATPGPLIIDNQQGKGVGEETVYVDSDGSAWLIYNPWSTGQVPNLFRPAEAARIGWGRGAPFIAAAGKFPSKP